MLSIRKSVKEASDGASVRVPEQALASTEPLVFRNLVTDWPLVKEARIAPAAADRYIRRFYEKATVGAFVGDPAIDGRFFYNDDLTGFNYETVRVKLDTLLDALQKHCNNTRAPAFYVASTTIDNCLPGLRAENDLDFGDVNPLASVWIGNRSRIAAHFDVPDNLACVAAGRRRFTLFPPEELDNLYVGPLDFTPAGQPISMVDFSRPDFERFPRFQAALQNAQTAELAPGDAILIPSMWWHHVESLDSFNVLINYWWRKSPAYMGTPTDVLRHAIMSLRALPEEQRDAWYGILKHYVFDPGQTAVEHIPENSRGILSPLNESTARQLRAELLNGLNR
ncbi:MAG: cupin-like domain-containing protein [Woeseia sp.]